MEDAAIYTSLLLNFLGAISMLTVCLSQVRRQRFTQSSAKKRYSLLVLGIWVVSVAVFFPGLVYLYDSVGYPQSIAHGAAIILMVIGNFILSVVMIVVGRVLLGWKSMPL